MLTTGQFSTACLLLAAGCSAPGGEARARDTLVVGAAPVTTNAPPITATPTPDSAVYTIHAFSASAAPSVTPTVPEMALVAPDGRQAGFDPVTRKVMSQIPGADYDSSATVEDDDVPTGESPPIQAIDSRELEVPAHAGGTYTLLVTAAVTGRYLLKVSLYPGDGNRNVGRNFDDLALVAGEPRRFMIRVGRGTMEMTP